MILCLCGASLYTLSDSLRIETPHFTPEFITIPIEVNERGCKFKAVDRGQFSPDLLLYVQTDNKELVDEFIFELVHDGLDLSAGNSIR